MRRKLFRRLFKSCIENGLALKRREILIRRLVPNLAFSSGVRSAVKSVFVWRHLEPCWWVGSVVTLNIGLLDKYLTILVQHLSSDQNRGIR